MPGSTDGRTAGWREYAVRVLWVLPVVIALAGYRWIGLHTEATGIAWTIRLPLDDRIPFVSGFVYPYFFWYLYSYGAILLLMLRVDGRHTYRRYVFAMFLALLVALVVFVVLPTTVLRPDIPGDHLAARMVRRLYAVDPPYNCLPSIHVAFSVLTALAFDRLLRSKAKWHPVMRGAGRIANLVAAVLICLSTLFIKQHYSPDLFAGIAVALAADYGSQKILLACERSRAGKNTA